MRTPCLSTEQILQAFGRSGSLLIDLAVHVPSDLPERVTKGYNDIAEVVAAQFHRVRSLRLSAAVQFCYVLFLERLLASLPSSMKYFPLNELILSLKYIPLSELFIRLYREGHHCMIFLDIAHR